jgi:protein-S-isoprenylcysteine O-methyltransferase Ste14
MILSSLSIFLAVVGFGLVHSLLTSLTAKSLAQHWLGTSTGRVYRLFFNFMGVLTLLAALVLNLGLSLYIFVGTYFEERKLRKAFGPAYAAYQRRTLLYFPGWQFIRRT